MTVVYNEQAPNNYVGLEKTNPTVQENILNNSQQDWTAYLNVYDLRNSHEHKLDLIKKEKHSFN
jgi:hypothetical protein